MSDSLIAKKQQDKTIYLKDYQAPAFLIDSLDLNIDLYEDYALVRSVMKLHRNPKAIDQTVPLMLNGEELTLEAIKINDQELTKTAYEVNENVLIIPNTPAIFTLQTIVKIYPAKNTALSGLYRSNKTFCTQCEAEGFRRITYFIDRPDVLTQFTTTISASEKDYPILLSNGNLVASGQLEGGRHWVKWVDPFKKPSYLFALVAGDFDLLCDEYLTLSKRKVDLKIYVEKGYGEQAHHAMHALKEAMHWDETTYGREYDLDVYMIVAIGDFNMGAMENKGLNIFNTKYILAKPETATDEDYIHILSVVGHEYFHNWTGNRVTCRDWFQLSLKEGLTIFRDQSFTEDLLSHAVMRIKEVTALRESQFPEDASPLAHPVRPDTYIEINNFYTATVYNKGAEVLRMLQTILGKTLFRRGMDIYFERYDGHAVTIEDYIRCMEDVSGINLKQFRLWYTQAGTPIVAVTDDYDGAKKVYTLSFHQTCPSTPMQAEKKAMVIPIRLGLLDKEGKAMPLQCDKERPSDEQVLLVTEPTQMFHFQNIPHPPTPSLLRDFSAPIILDYTYTDNDLIFLFKHDTDPFNRFEAGQKYILRLLLNLAHDYQQEKPLTYPDELIAMFGWALQYDNHDKFLLAEMLTLPSEKYIGEQMKIIDVDAIHAARDFLLTHIAEKLQALFLAIYQDNHHPDANYRFSMAEVGKRQLKNRCLSYLTLLPNYLELATDQFSKALTKNMTDTQAALIALTNMDSAYREQALDAFYQAWKTDALVIDKWFAIQAGTKLPVALKQVKKLMRHEAFDIKNPNKVYALIGTFGYRNLVNFHAEGGEGYAFLRDTVQQLDKLNPQVAARMVKPLTTWGRYDKERQALMREQLALLLEDNKLSNDVYEIASKSLERP